MMEPQIATLLTLPDALLVECLGRVALDDRCRLSPAPPVRPPAAALRPTPALHHTLRHSPFPTPTQTPSPQTQTLYRLLRCALVCRRLRALCLSPQLLHALEARIAGPRVLPRTHALAAWLASHGRHIQVLKLDVQPPAPDAAACAELEAAVSACLAAAAATARGLQRLQLVHAVPRGPATWLLQMTALQDVMLFGNLSAPLHLPSGLAALTSLRRLGLSGRPLILDGELPPSLTYLLLAGNGTQALPPQVRPPWCAVAAHARLVSGRLAHLPFSSWQLSPTPLNPPTPLTPQVACLPKLQHLGLAAGYDCAAMSGLAQLTGLTSLSLNVQALPCVLSTLTQLRALQLTARSPSAATPQQLDAALRPLRGLTRLVLRGHSMLEELPPALAGMPRLRHCMLGRPPHPASPEEAAQPAQLDKVRRRLPAGTWLAGLQSLCAPYDVLTNSLELLAAAAQLQHVSLEAPPSAADAGQPAWRSLWAWAAAHPPLARLSVEGDAPLPPALAEALRRLQLRRPSLLVFRGGADGNLSYLESIAFAA